MFGPVETANGYVMLAIASREDVSRALIKVIGHPEWIADPRFLRYNADRRDNWADLMNGVEEWSRTLTTEKMPRRVEWPWCSVVRAYRTVAEALRDPQITHRGALSEVRDGGGTFNVLNLPFSHVRGQCFPRENRWRPWGEHTVCVFLPRERPSRKMKSRLSQANRLRRSGADDTSAPAC